MSVTKPATESPKDLQMVLYQESPWKKADSVNNTIYAPESARSIIEGDFDRADKLSQAEKKLYRERRVALSEVTKNKMELDIPSNILQLFFEYTGERPRTTIISEENKQKQTTVVKVTKQGMKLIIPKHILKLLFEYSGEHAMAQGALVQPNRIDGSSELHLSLVGGPTLATLKQRYEKINRAIYVESDADVEAKKYLSTLNLLSLIQNPEERSQAVYLLLEAMEADPAVTDWWPPVYHGDTGEVVFDTVIDNLETLIPNPTLRQRLLQNWVESQVFMPNGGLHLMLNRGATLVPDTEARKSMITHFVNDLFFDVDPGKEKSSDAEQTGPKHEATTLPPKKGE